MLLQIHVLNTPGSCFECEGLLREACFRVKGLGLKLGADLLVVRGRRDAESTWGDPTIVAKVDLRSEREIPKEIREKLGRAVAAAIGRTHGARHHPVTVVVTYFGPKQVTLYRRK